MLSKLSRRKSRSDIPAEQPRKTYRPLPVEARVTLGGWYQRTTLHLSEVFTFMSEGRSKLRLRPDKLAQHHQALELASVAREVSYLEYVHAVTKSGIDIRYYEDGLYVLEITKRDVDDATEELERYYDESFAPALAYLFSLGAPTPKILSQMPTTHPIVVSLHWPQPKRFEVNPAYGHVYSRLATDNIAVYKTHSHIFIASGNQRSTQTADLVDMHIFFREFKDQLEKYLDIHRTIWEDIAKITERTKVQPAQLARMRARLESSQKTVNLISNRMNQMDAYAATRAKLAEQLALDQDLVTLFQYRFETLTDTLRYVQELWGMTQAYVDQSLEILDDVRAKTMNTSIESLRAITTIGVLVSVIGWVTTDAFPSITLSGVAYFIGLLIVALAVNWLATLIGQHREYRLKFPDTPKYN